MQLQRRNRELIKAETERKAAIRNAVELWAAATTSEGARRDDLVRDKRQAVMSFFEFVNKHPADVTPMDVRRWLTSLEKKGLRPATIYQRACLLSSFYTWAMKDAELGLLIRSNPARLARPKAPRAYQTESVKSLTDD